MADGTNGPEVSKAKVQVTELQKMKPILQTPEEKENAVKTLTSIVESPESKAAFVKEARARGRVEREALAVSIQNSRDDVADQLIPDGVEYEASKYKELERLVSEVMAEEVSSQKPEAISDKINSFMDDVKKFFGGLGSKSVEAKAEAVASGKNLWRKILAFGSGTLFGAAAFIEENNDNKPTIFTRLLRWLGGNEFAVIHGELGEIGSKLKEDTESDKETMKTLKQLYVRHRTPRSAKDYPFASFIKEIVPKLEIREEHSLLDFVEKAEKLEKPVPAPTPAPVATTPAAPAPTPAATPAAVAAAGAPAATPAAPAASGSAPAPTPTK